MSDSPRVLKALGGIARAFGRTAGAAPVDALNELRALEADCLRRPPVSAEYARTEVAPDVVELVSAVARTFGCKPRDLLGTPLETVIGTIVLDVFRRGLDARGGGWRDDARTPIVPPPPRRS